VQGGIELDLMDADDISRAVGAGGVDESAKLRHVYQLTGFSDPVYAEASVTVHDYDIILEMTIINRTGSTLTNLTVELATMGDLKIVERPQSYTLAPRDVKKLRANIKVSSTETGHIFGTIVFDNSATAVKTFVNLNDIQLDIMDYIRPAECKNDDFRAMWAEFEWENKVAINTNILDLREFLSHIITNTNMTCLSSLGEGESAVASLEGSNFLAANLYARSVFGEDALVNVSVEKKDDADGKLNGYIRIRSKTQGIALSLGDRITAVQRAVTAPEQP
jgi:coatomer subunit beta